MHIETISFPSKINALKRNARIFSANWLQHRNLSNVCHMLSSWEFSRRLSMNYHLTFRIFRYIKYTNVPLIYWIADMVSQVHPIWCSKPMSMHKLLSKISTKVIFDMFAAVIRVAVGTVAVVAYLSRWRIWNIELFYHQNGNEAFNSCI